MGYDFDGDLADPAGSVFCSHGAGVVVPWDQVKKHMHVQTPLDKRRAAGVDLPDRKEREDESSGAGVPEGRSGAGAGGGRSSAAGTGEGCRRRIMRTGSWRRFLSVPTGNRSAAIRREMPWARERPEAGVQASRVMEPAAARVQTAQARKRPGAGGRAAAVPGHGGQTARTGRAAGELERQIPAPAQRRNIFWWTATTLFSPGRS